MGAEGVVADPPVLDNPSRLGKRGEDVLVQALVAKPAVEALDEGVLDRLAWRDVMPMDPRRIREGEDGVGGELRPVARQEGGNLSRRAEPLRRAARRLRRSWSADL